MYRVYTRGIHVLEDRALRCRGSEVALEKRGNARWSKMKFVALKKWLESLADKERGQDGICEK